MWVVQESFKGDDRRTRFTSAVPTRSGEAVYKQNSVVVPRHDRQPGVQVTAEDEMLDLSMGFDCPAGFGWRCHDGYYPRALSAGRLIVGIPFQIFPSSRRPPAFGVIPPHCLKKNGTLATMH